MKKYQVMWLHYRRLNSLVKQAVAIQNKEKCCAIIWSTICMVMLGTEHSRQRGEVLLLHYMDMQLMLGVMVAVSGRTQELFPLPCSWMLAVEVTLLLLSCPHCVCMQVAIEVNDDFYGSPAQEAISSIPSTDCFCFIL